MALTPDTAVRRRGWYYGWNIVAVTVLAQAAGNGLPINTFPLFLGDWSKDLHASNSQLLLGLAGCGLMASLLSPLVGYLADKLSSRWIFAFGLGAMAAFYWLLSQVTGSGQFAALYGLLFPVALVCCTTIPANAAVSRWFVKHLGLALGITGFGLGLSGVIIPPVVAAIEPTLGWRAIWRGAALLTAFVALPLALLVLRPRPTGREGLHYVTGHGEAVRGGHHGAGGAGGRSGLTYVGIVTRPNFWLLLAVYLPMLAVYGACGQNAGRIAAGHGIGQQSTAMLIALYSLAGVAANLGGGLLSDRFGNRGPLVALALLTALGGVVMAFAGNLAELALGVMLAGLGGGFWPLLAAAFTVEFGRAGFGRAFGLAALFVPIGGSSPVIVSKIQEATGSYVPGLLAFSAACAIGGALCLLLREKPRSQAPDDAAPALEAALPAG